MMNEKKRALEFKVNPLWKFLEENYGIEEAFRIFGPYRGASITPRIIDRNTTEVTMPLVLSNTNYVGTQFGGSLYSMCDPFYMFILMANLGENFIVWDKSAKIEFLKPGRGTVKVLFHIPNSELDEIHRILKTEKKVNRNYETEITDMDGVVIAKVYKELYIRKMI